MPFRDMEVTDKELMRKRKPTSIKQVPRKETDGQKEKHDSHVTSKERKVFQQWSG